MNRILGIVIATILFFMANTASGQISGVVKEYNFGTRHHMSSSNEVWKTIAYGNKWYKVPVIDNIVPQFRYLRYQDGRVHTVQYFYGEGRGKHISRCTEYDSRKVKMVPIKKKPKKIADFVPPQTEPKINLKSVMLEAPEPPNLDLPKPTAKKQARRRETTIQSRLIPTRPLPTRRDLPDIKPIIKMEPLKIKSVLKRPSDVGDPQVVIQPNYKGK